MKTLILYTSKTGNTKTYAEDIAKQVNGDVAPLKGFRVKKMQDYDTIVFGGWVEGGTIKGLDKFLSFYPKISKKNVIVFSVGMAVPTPDGRSLMIEQNLLDMYHVRYYQFRGSFDMKKLHFPYNLLIMNSLKMMANDATATADQKMLLGIKDNPIIVYDREKVDKVVSVLNQLSLADVLAKESATK
jgi:menaquinone-dependent protoporphyrinogen IX oxidase